MTPSDSSGGNKPTDNGGVALTGVDRLFGRDLRSKGWVLKLAPVPETARTDEMQDIETAPEADPAMIWALRWRRR